MRLPPLTFVPVSSCASAHIKYLIPLHYYCNMWPIHSFISPIHLLTRDMWRLSSDCASWQSYDKHVAMHCPTWHSILTNDHPSFRSQIPGTWIMAIRQVPWNTTKKLPLTGNSVITDVQLYALVPRPFVTNQKFLYHILTTTKAHLFTPRSLAFSAFVHIGDLRLSINSTSLLRTNWQATSILITNLSQLTALQSSEFYPLTH